MAKKQYKYRTDIVDTFDLEDVLKKRGNEGWLLVGTIDTGFSIKLIFVRDAKN